MLRTSASHSWYLTHEILASKHVTLNITEKLRKLAIFTMKSARHNSQMLHESLSLSLCSLGTYRSLTLKVTQLKNVIFKLLS